MTIASTIFTAATTIAATSSAATVSPTTVATPPITTTSETIWPLAVYFILVIGLVLVMLTLSHLLGQRRHEKATDEPYESGIVSVGSARIRFSVSFYLIAILFVVFDLEAIFLFAWAVAFEEAGVAGFVEASIFIGILSISLLYLWRLGALDWTAKQRSLEGKRSGNRES